VITVFCYRITSERNIFGQEKSHTLEAQLAETTAQLQELKDRQKPLEARNALLEKLMQLNKRSLQTPVASTPSGEEARSLLAHLQHVLCM